jgi:CspA family cold shock protein
MTDTQTDNELTRVTGMVKWFNNKAGYGFITACEGEQKGKDIFVHYSSISVDNQQYRFLTQGEYVDFSLVKSDSEKYEYLAKNITGVKGGPILCETRRLNVGGSLRSDPHDTIQIDGPSVEAEHPALVNNVRKPRKPRPSPQVVSDKATQSFVDEEGFTTVKKRSGPRAKKPVA